MTVDTIRTVLLDAGLTPSERKRFENRLKVTVKRPKTHNTGFFTNEQWARMKKRRKAAQASRRRNRRG